MPANILDAYKQNQRLEDFVARLPADAAAVIDELENADIDGPLQGRAQLLLAQCHELVGQSAEAKRVFETLLQSDPGNVVANIDLAKIYNREGAVQQSIELLQRVAGSAPEVAEVWQRLSESLQQDGQAEKSQEANKQFQMIKSFNDRLQAAEQAFAKADFMAADKACRHLLQLVPSEVRTLRLLCRIARQFDHFEFSTATLARCVEARPSDAALRLEYAYSLLGSRQFADALEQCRRVAELAPENIAVYKLEAEVLYNLGRYEQAVAIYQQLAKLPEARVSSLLYMGKIQKTLGKRENAERCYQQVIELEPATGQAYWELADLKTYRFSSAEIDSMRAQLDVNDGAPIDQVMIGFALGKALEDAQQFAESFKHYHAANSNYLKLRPYTYTNHNDRFESQFTREYFTASGAQGHASDAAIFVVGLPRSGTTLLEQILSSHSRIDATQELDEMVSIARSLNEAGKPEQNQYPYSLQHLGAEQTLSLAQRYLDYAKPRRQQAPYFVDKAPQNFQHIGLIKTLFPNAKIIDIQRDPMAGGWSLYRQFFGDSNLFSYSLETIGQYYNDYRELMDHWHATLPGQILTIRYEDLVGDFATTVRTILDYCQLDFEDACLDFHNNQRAVATPSAEQVRQPLYNDALQHWQNFAAFLEPLMRVVASRETLEQQ